MMLRLLAGVLAVALYATALIAAPWNAGPGEIFTPPAGGAGIAFVQEAHSTGSSGTTVVATMNGTVAGNLIAVELHWCNNSSCNNAYSSTLTVADTHSTTCTEVTNARALTNRYTTIFLCPNNGSSGNDTITATFNQSVSYPTIFVQEFSGVATTSPDDGIGNNATQTSTSLTVSTNGSATQTNELILGILQGFGTITAGQTQVAQQAPASGQVLVEYTIPSTTGTKTLTATSTSTPVANNESIAGVKHP